MAALIDSPFRIAPDHLSGRHSQFILTAFSQPEDKATDSLTELLRSGARELIAQAVEAELQTSLNQYADVRFQDGRNIDYLVLILGSIPMFV